MRPTSIRRALLSAVATLAILGFAPAGFAQDTEAPRAGPSGGDVVGYGQVNHPEVGRDGMVVAQSKLAANVGAAILRSGGNAVDAAVALAFAEAVTLPRAGNLGGGGYMLVHMAKGDETIAIEYYSQVPMATTPDLLVGADGKFDRAKGYSFKGAAVPGTVAGLWAAHKRFGKLPWRTVVQPAVDLAQRGFILTDDEVYSFDTEGKAMAKDPEAHRIFARPDGSPYLAGDRLIQADLAWTLSQIRDHGPDAFYRGAVAERLVKGVQAGGGIISASDLANYKAKVAPPIWGDYRGYRIAYMVPTGSGATLDEAMNLLEHFPMKTLGWGTAAEMHVISEAMKVAWADHPMLAGSPADVATVSSKAFAAKRAERISMTTSLSSATLKQADGYVKESPDTTHFSVADAEGDVVSNTFTLSASFGAHVITPGTGFLLNNSMGNMAWGKQGGGAGVDRPPPPTPGVHVSSTITPVIVFKDAKPWLVSGTPGGAYIIATMAQLLVNVIDHGLNIAEAGQRPRINQTGVDGPLELEPSVSEDEVALLQAKGHKVVRSNTMGSVQTIMIDKGLFYGSADTRRPDSAAVAVR